MPTRAAGGSLRERASRAQERPLVFGFFKRRKREPPAPRALLQGPLRIGEREWQVREERRQGPFPQLFVFSDAGEPSSQMHVRVPESDPVTELEQVAARASDASYRWFVDAAGDRWEARLVLPDPPDRRLVKFVCWERGVHEGEWPFPDGLGLSSDEELRRLLDALRA